MRYNFMRVILLYHGQVSGTHVAIFRGIYLQSSIQLCLKCLNQCAVLAIWR